MNAQLGLSSASAEALLTESFSYDPTGRPTGATDSGPYGSISIPGTEASGSITVEGADRQEDAGTPGKGTITIAGSERTITCPNGGSGTCYDQGSIQVNFKPSPGNPNDPFFYIIPYGQNSTPQSIATAIAQAINNDPYGVVVASASSATVNLTSVVNGYSTNFAFTSAVQTPNTPGSFTSTTSGSTLTGGTTTGSTAIYDNGVVTVSAFGQNVNVNWGQGSTPASIASSIASAITSIAGGTLNVTTDGNGDVYLTANQVGTVWNGSLVAITTYNSGNFGDSSYTFVTTPMSGGTNATTVQGRATEYSYQLTYDGNGNVVTATDSANGNSTYEYDDLNRLTLRANSTSSTSYGYDAWGNLAGTGASSSGPQVTWITYNTKNQVTGDSIIPAGFVYDAAGNVENDGINTYKYDGAGRLCAVANGSSGAVTQYIYNAEGQRTARANGGSIAAGAIPSCSQAVPSSPTELFILDPAGNQVTELTVSGTAWQWARTNVFAAGGLLASGDAHGIHFHMLDWLGNRRVQVAGASGQSVPAGAVELTCTNNPWGTSLGCTGSGTDSTEHHFTGKERDVESGNDYFGARYYSSLAGRWMSPDWDAPAVSVPYAVYFDPQTLNLYRYTGNNPTSRQDHDGHCWPLCTVAIGATVGAISGGAVEYFSEKFSGGTVNWSKVGNAAVAGAIGGAAVGLVGGGPVGAVLLGGVSSTISSQAQRVLNGDTGSHTKDDVVTFVVGAATTKIVDSAVSQSIATEVVAKPTAEVLKATVDFARDNVSQQDTPSTPSIPPQSGPPTNVTVGCAANGTCPGVPSH